MDPRSKKDLGFDIDKVDLSWIEKENDKIKLKKALRALKLDGGYYPHLEEAIDKKLQSLDPNYLD